MAGAARARGADGGPRRAAAWRDAAPLVALAASGPLLWALHDLLLTGDALHSLTGTRDNAALLGRVTGIEHVPTTVPRRLGEILREPVLLAAAGGGVLALAWRRDRRVRLGVAAGLLALAAFCVLAAAGLPIITRYLLLTATLLAIFAGAGVFGWLDLLPGRERTWWARFAALALVALLVFVPSQARRIDRLGNALARQEAIQGKLGELVAGERLRAAGRGSQPAADPAAGAVAGARPRADRRRAGRPAAGRHVPRAGDRAGRPRLHPRPPRPRPPRPVGPAGLAPARGQFGVADVRQARRRHRRLRALTTVAIRHIGDAHR